MNELSVRLKNVNEAGVFNINCELTDVLAAVNEAQLVLFSVDLAAVHSKSEFLATVAQAIAAPDWFGKNWDALADALGDLSWKPAPGYVLVFKNGADTFHLLAHDHGVANDILTSTVNFWKTQSKPFWVFCC